MIGVLLTDDFLFLDFEPPDVFSDSVFASLLFLFLLMMQVDGSLSLST